MKKILTLCLAFVVVSAFAQTNTSVATFKDCSMGDLLHIEFDGLNVDFGSGKNNYSGYNLCIEDNNGYTIANPKYVGKQFLINWKMIKTKVMSDPLEPWKTEMKEMPSIVSIQLLDKSKGYAIGTFKDCSMGDLLHVEFSGIELDFGSGKNNYSGYNLCIEDKDGYTISNPIYVGKKFLVRYKMIETKVMSDPLEPWKTETRKMPSIVSLKLLK